MSDSRNSKTILSRWIKVNDRTDEVSTTSKHGTADNPAVAGISAIERQRRAQQWSDIFRSRTHQSKIPNDSQEDANNLRVAPTSSDNSTADSPKFMITLRYNGGRPPAEKHISPENVDGSKADIKFNKPSFIHVLRAPKEKLKEIKPKVHPFFAKRQSSVAKSSSPSTQRGAEKSNSFTIRGKYPLSRVVIHNTTAPWDIVHIRPQRSWGYSKLRRRQRTQSSSTSEFNFGLLPVYVPPKVHAATRLLASSARVQAIAKGSQSPAFIDSNKSLMARVGDRKAFDLGEFESNMWCDIYAPQSWQDHLTPPSTKEVYNWLSHQFETRHKYMAEHKPQGRGRPRNNGYSLDDGFVVNDADTSTGNAPDDVLILTGPTGAGKTSAVYAAAKSLDAFVFEVSPSVKRTGKELSSMLDGISQNHAVHKARNVVILIDDGDIIYENEAGSFWATLSKFSVTSRRPVIITCTDPRSVALTGVAYETLQFPRPNLVRVTDLAWLIALSEGHLIDRLRLARLAVAWQGDLRRVLTQLQLWCQYGIGGSPSSEEWVAKDFEMVENHADRVISQGSWFPDAPPSSESETRSDLKIDVTHSQNDIVSAELASVRDLFPVETATYTRADPEETISTNGGLSLSEWEEPIHIPYRGNEQVLRNIYSMEASYGTSAAEIAVDVSPYMRFMVASDYQRWLVMQQALMNQSERGARMTRRMLQASGIDSRQYLELSKASMEIVLNSGYPRNSF